MCLCMRLSVWICNWFKTKHIKASTFAVCMLSLYVCIFCQLEGECDIGSLLIQDKYVDCLSGQALWGDAIMCNFIHTLHADCRVNNMLSLATNPYSCNDLDWIGYIEGITDNQMYLIFVFKVPNILHTKHKPKNSFFFQNEWSNQTVWFDFIDHYWHQMCINVSLRWTSTHSKYIM